MSGRITAVSAMVVRPLLRLGQMVSSRKRATGQALHPDLLGFSNPHEAIARLAKSQFSGRWAGLVVPSAHIEKSQ
jgi:hypothetical protein